MGFKQGKEQAAQRNGHSKEDADMLYRTPGAGVLVQREARNGTYAAGSQKHFLKRGSGTPDV